MSYFSFQRGTGNANQPDRGSCSGECTGFSGMRVFLFLFVSLFVPYPTIMRKESLLNFQLKKKEKETGPFPGDLGGQTPLPKQRKDILKYTFCTDLKFMTIISPTPPPPTPTPHHSPQSCRSTCKQYRPRGLT